MKILAFQGSPRLKGNTDLLLDAFLEGAQEGGGEIEKINLYRIDLKPCLECGECDETGECVIPDDMREIYPKLDQAHVIVVASPIFFYNITSRTQALVERSQARWVAKYVLKRTLSLPHPRYGLFLSLGATQGKKLFEGVQRVIKYFFDALQVEYQGGLFYRGVEKKGAIKTHPSALKEAHALGYQVASGVPPEKWPVTRALTP